MAINPELDAALEKLAQTAVEWRRRAEKARADEAYWCRQAERCAADSVMLSRLRDEAEADRDYWQSIAEESAVALCMIRKTVEALPAASLASRPLGQTPAHEAETIIEALGRVSERIARADRLLTHKCDMLAMAGSLLTAANKRARDPAPASEERR